MPVWPAAPLQAPFMVSLTVSRLMTVSDLRRCGSTHVAH